MSNHPNRNKQKIITHAVIQSGYCVFGAGHGESAAIADAAQCMENENGKIGISENDVRDIIKPTHNHAHGDFIVLSVDHPDFDSYLSNQGGYSKTESGWIAD